MTTYLYKRNNDGKPLQWSIEPIYEDGKIIVSYGLVDGRKHIETFSPKLKTVADEVVSRINQKRKEGYKELSELYDNAPGSLSDDNLYEYLDTHLPKFNTTSEGLILPMLAKTLEDNKPFVKGDYLGQWKINGLRCIVGAVTSNDLFNPIKFTYQSREGIRWNLNSLDDILLKSIPQTILDMMIEEGVHLDGEVYLPGYSVNEINSFVKNPSLPQHNILQYWCYDICMENASFVTRDSVRNLYFHSISILDRNDHYNNEARFVSLPSIYIGNYDEAKRTTKFFVSCGFEGLIIKESNSEYQFGKRNSAMYKMKPIYDGLFKIVDIIPEGARRSNLPKFILKNDINDNTFECTMKGSHANQEIFLAHKNEFIGKSALVEFRERSGISQVPFHAKIDKVYV